MNLMCFYSIIICIIQERAGWVDCAFLDLEKMSDKVPRKTLLIKKTGIQVEYRVNSWIT